MAMEIKHLQTSEADEISRLRAEIAELKQKLEDAKASAYAESVDAGMRERRLKRALYKACANWAKAMDFYEDNPNELWSKMKYKCRKKSKEYL